MGRYLHGWNGADAKKVGVGKHLAESFPKTHRSVLAPSWLPSIRAWETATEVRDKTPSYTGTLSQPANAPLFFFWQSNDTAALVAWARPKMSKTLVIGPYRDTFLEKLS